MRRFGNWPWTMKIIRVSGSTVKHNIKYTNTIDKIIDINYA